MAAHCQRRGDCEEREHTTAYILHAQSEDVAVDVQRGCVGKIQGNVPDDDAEEARSANEPQQTWLACPRPDRHENHQG